MGEDAVGELAGHDIQASRAVIEGRDEGEDRGAGVGGPVHVALNDIIAALERRRLAEASRGVAAASTIRTSDLGQLDWPVNGNIIYRFGRQQLGNNTPIRWNGIGIAVGRGTPVKSVAPGTVRLARSLGTYGPSVVIDHGGGYYTVYCFLDEIQVRENQQIAKGDVVGLSGGENSDQGPHIEFQVRKEGQALDPIAWLRRRQ